MLSSLSSLSYIVCAAISALTGSLKKLTHWEDCCWMKTSEMFFPVFDFLHVMLYNMTSPRRKLSFYELHLLTLENINKYQILLFMFSFHNNLLPRSLHTNIASCLKKFGYTLSLYQIFFSL